MICMLERSQSVLSKKRVQQVAYFKCSPFQNKSSSRSRYISASITYCILYQTKQHVLTISKCLQIKQEDYKSGLRKMQTETIQVPESQMSIGLRSRMWNRRSNLQQPMSVGIGNVSEGNPTCSCRKLYVPQGTGALSCPVQ